MIVPEDLKVMLDLTEERYLIKLGLADKMNIVKRAREYNIGFDDFGFFVRRHLNEFGYKSRLLQERNKEAKEFERDFTNYVLEKYGFPMIN